MSPLIIIIVVVLIVAVGLLILLKLAAPYDSARSLDLDAQRFAKLLVNEIKLNNRSQIDVGRQHKDLYRRLKKDVDRARRMYDKRVPEDVAERTDYFHDALVRELAGGDVFALGADYQRR